MSDSGRILNGRMVSFDDFPATGNDLTMPRRHALADQQVVDLVIERFSPMKHGHPPEPYSVLAKRHGLSEKTLQAAVIRAFQRGLITLDVVRIPPRYYDIPHFAQRLRARFRSLRMAIVVEPEGDDPDTVHCALGHALAQKIASESSFFRPSDVIGIGTGRAVHYTTYYLSRLLPADIDDITIMSLTGSFFMLTHSDMKTNRVQHFVDADSNANLLSHYFSGSHKVHPISLPIAHPPEQRNDLITNTLLNPLEFGQHTPSHAIVGLGVFRKSNGLMQEVERHRSAEPTILREILNRLSRVAEIITHFEGRFDNYCPVGDICNLLFYIPPPTDPLGGEKRLLDNLQDDIRAINSMLITPTRDQLNKINNLIVVAGTEEKAAGISHVLKSGEVRIRGLCTDKKTAQMILDS